MNKSESIAHICAALAAFQAEKIKVHKGKEVKGSYTYATLESIIDSIQPYLSQHGLSFSQIAEGNGSEICVTTILMHKSGEYMQGVAGGIVEIPTSRDGRKLMNYAQAYGSMCTYFKKYGLAAILGIATTDDEILDPDAREDNGYDGREDLKRIIMESIMAGTFSEEKMQAALVHYKAKGIDSLNAQQLQAIINRINAV